MFRDREGKVKRVVPVHQTWVQKHPGLSDERKKKKSRGFLQVRGQNGTETNTECVASLYRLSVTLDLSSSLPFW